MAAVLSSDMDRTEKVIILLNECEDMKLHVSPPDINRSNYYFDVLDDNNLMYGLGAIKGVGQAAIDNIIEAISREFFHQIENMARHFRVNAALH